MDKPKFQYRMKKILFLLLLTSPFFVFAQNELKLNGSIGSYNIEIELTPNKGAGKLISGKYRYQGKTAYLNLEGKLYSKDLLYLQESYNGETTGHFYLEHEEGNWNGRWTNGKKAYEVTLMAVGGDLNDFELFGGEKVEEGTNTELAGTYSSDIYFINDYFYTEENPSIEIGYNGGTVSITQMESDSIWVELNTTSGPTYHIAYFEQAVPKVADNTYEYDDFLWEDNDEKCHLKFTFDGNGMLSVEQYSNNMACDFGMRAYAGGEYKKYTNESKDLEN